jgi:hypothetical protein
MNPITVQAGVDLELEFRLSGAEFIYVPITAVSQTAPVRLTAPAHGLPDGWSFWIEGIPATGPASLNRNRFSAQTPYQAVFVDVDTIEINAVNGIGLPAYDGGGVLVYQEPVDITGATAVLVLRKDASTPAAVTATGAVDAVNSVIRFAVPAASVTLPFERGLYQADITLLGGAVRLLGRGAMSVNSDLTP